MLTGPDITAIKNMRERLTSIEGRLDVNDDRDYPIGRLAEACRAADDALLHILITGNVRGLGVPDSALD